MQANNHPTPSPAPSIPHQQPQTPLPAPRELPSSQPRLRNVRRSDWDKIHDILGTITKDFRSLGHFFEVLFHNRDRKLTDPRTPRHIAAVSAFLSGNSNVGMGTIIELIYNHLDSRPPRASNEYSFGFSPPHLADGRTITYARPALSTWALLTVGVELRRQIGILTQNDPENPSDRTQLRASTNGRANDVQLATWDHFNRLSIPEIAQTYARRAPAVWYATECMAAPMKKGVVVVRKRRPHTTVQVGVINALTFSRNRYATGYLALPLAVWQFATKTHIDEKRVFSRFGFTVHETTARACIDSLTDAAMASFRREVAAGVQDHTMHFKIILDNVQQFARQRDLRLGRGDVLKVGTAATAVRLYDCAPGAFALQPHLDLVLLARRKELTTQFLYDQIDFKVVNELAALHWVRILVHFVPQLAYLRKAVAAEFLSERLAKRRLPKDRVTDMQPLGTNAEREVENDGMKRSILDFEQQMGLGPDEMKDLIIMVCGDGASYAAILRLKKYLSAHSEHHEAFRHCVPPGPEIWHTRWTNLSAIASNTYGPSTTTDPSALSKSATASGAKRPSNLKKVDFFPTSRSMLLFFEARVLDCWRIEFDAHDILEYFEQPRQQPFSLDSLLVMARKLVKRYASQHAWDQAMDPELADTCEPDMKFSPGTPWVPPKSSLTHENSGRTQAGDPEAVADGALDEDIVRHESLSESVSAESLKRSGPERHEEADDFRGDRVLANEILFLQDMGWWVIANHAVPEGEVGHLWEIMKIWIFMFSGSTNRNYATYLLENFCLHQYESTKEFSDAIFNNLLINPKGRGYLEGDWLQEDFNKWLEEMVEHKGGEFDDHFYRHTLSPNVRSLLWFKEIIESAFSLKLRTKTHGAPHLRHEFQQLLRMHREDELHCYRPARTMGHAATNFFAKGYERLDCGRLDEFIKDSTAYSDIMRDVLNGEEKDYWNETHQRHWEDMMREDLTDYSSDDEEGESDQIGDPTLHGIEYEDESDSENASAGHRQTFKEDLADDDETGSEEQSEMEQEEMDPEEESADEDE